VAGIVELIVGPATESVQRLIDDGAEPFDLVFIDADKPSNPREFITAMGGNRALEATVLQTVGLKGWDGFSIAVVTS
jgi:hypothetical protein